MGHILQAWNRLHLLPYFQNLLQIHKLQYQESRLSQYLVVLEISDDDSIFSHFFTVVLTFGNDITYPSSVECSPLGSCPSVFVIDRTVSCSRTIPVGCIHSPFLSGSVILVVCLFLYLSFF